jgi:hypothetical protein
MPFPRQKSPEKGADIRFVIDDQYVDPGQFNTTLKKLILRTEDGGQMTAKSKT